MPTHTSPTDPRSIITPDAFDVSEELLGMPLARPGKRLVALIIDLVVIGLVTLVTKSFSLVLGVVAAVMFIRAGFKRTPVRGSVFGRAMRFSVGCLGIVVAMVTAILWSAFGWGLGQGGDEVNDRVQAALEEQGVAAGADLDLGDAASLALRARLVQEVAADTLAALEADVEELEDENAATARRLSSTRAALEEATEGGLFNWLRNFVDELGFGFGWATLYMTVILSWWKGQTVGKRLMGIRVVRLDGEAITWWTAFERAGGYAAGFATGLLGFAQVWWDANRQAIHDRIVGTVVVVDGAERVGNWEAAL